jgi:hypothetical protein
VAEIQEVDMTSQSWSFKMEPGVRGGLGEWEGLHSEKGAIKRVQEQGRDRYSVEKLARTRLRPVVDRIPKAVQPRCVTVV